MKLLSRSEALQAGATRYFTGEPCVRGHLSDRMVSNRRCVACLRADKAEWNAVNLERNAAAHRARVAAKPEHYKALKAASHRRNPEAQAARSRKWYLANKDQAAAATKRWAKNNPGHVTALARRYQADRLRRTPPWADLDLIADFYRLAGVLRQHGGLNVEVDHEVPLRGRRVSGLHVHHNLRLLDSTENKSKSNRFQTL